MYICTYVHWWLLSRTQGIKVLARGFKAFPLPANLPDSKVVLQQELVSQLGHVEQVAGAGLVELALEQAQQKSNSVVFQIGLVEQGAILSGVMYNVKSSLMHFSNKNSFFYLGTLKQRSSLCTCTTTLALHVNVN
jgi:hypothetical protein